MLKITKEICNGSIIIMIQMCLTILVCLYVLVILIIKKKINNRLGKLKIDDNLKIKIKVRILFM